MKCFSLILALLCLMYRSGAGELPRCAGAEQIIAQAAQTGSPNLNLHDLNLTEFPDGITELRNLKRLYLSGNEFRELPDNIGALVNLEECGWMAAR